MSESWDEGWVTNEEAARFRDLFMQSFQTKPQCEVHTQHPMPHGRCQNAAVYELHYNERVGKVCESCAPGWISTLTRRHPVTVVRL